MLRLWEIFEVGLNAYCVMMWPQAFGGQGMENGLNKMSPYGYVFGHLLAAGGAAWGGLGGAALLDEIWHWRLALRV